jgi:GAF domain-containing protein
MAESFIPAALPAAKRARYAALAEEIAAVLEGEAEAVARMASVAAMLAAAFPDFLWTGFYRVDAARPDELVVGPYQGTLGCLRIAFGKGVCGAAAARRKTILVADVAGFPGHIACDSRSRSEIVVPVFGPGGALLAVLDVDSAAPGAFDDADAVGLEAIAALVFPAQALETRAPAK